MERRKLHRNDHVLRSMVIPDLFGNESDNEIAEYMDDAARAKQQVRANTIREESVEPPDLFGVDSVEYDDTDIEDQISVEEKTGFVETKDMNGICTNMSHLSEQQRIRNAWKSGSIVEIYNEMTCKWNRGKIIDIFTDDEGEWLSIEYNNGESIEIQRYNDHVRAPIFVITDDPEKLRFNTDFRKWNHDEFKQYLKLLDVDGKYGLNDW